MLLGQELPGVWRTSQHAQASSLPLRLAPFQAMPFPVHYLNGSFNRQKLGNTRRALLIPGDCQSLTASDQPISQTA